MIAICDKYWEVFINEMLRSGALDEHLPQRHSFLLYNICFAKIHIVHFLG